MKDINEIDHSRTLSKRLKHAKTLKQRFMSVDIAVTSLSEAMLRGFANALKEKVKTHSQGSHAHDAFLVTVD